MKKPLHLLGLLVIVITLLLTGCGETKQETGMTQDVESKVSTTVADAKTNDPGNSSIDSQSKQNQAAQAETSKNPDDSKIADNKPAESKPAESKPAESKPAESKPAESKPAESKPAESKPAESKPAESKPAESKPAESKPAESKPAEGSPAKNQSSGPTEQNTGNTSAEAPTQQAPAAPTAAVVNTVTMSINCQTAVDNGLAKQEKFKDVVPASGVILAPTAIELKDGETAFDILKTIVREKKIHMEYEGSKGTPYIEGINNLYEFDGGPVSGWMYCVNKVYPNYGCGEYKLKAGDVIEWNYTCDLGKDLGQEWIQ